MIDLWCQNNQSQNLNSNSKKDEKSEEIDIKKIELKNSETLTNSQECKKNERLRLIIKDLKSVAKKKHHNAAKMSILYRTKDPI